MSDFTSSSVAHGLKFGEFDGLDANTKKKLIKLMARISEKSYRRGFQHGKETKGKTVDPFKFRFKTPLSASPYTETDQDGRWSSKSGHSSEDRLLIEYGVLHNIGLSK